MAPKVVQEDRGVKHAHTLDTPGVAIASSPTRLAASELAGKAKHVGDAAVGVSTVHEQEIAGRRTFRESPIQAIMFIEVMPLVLDRGLYPNLRAGAEKPLQLNYLDVARHVGPIVVPAYDTVTLVGVVAVSLEVSGPKFEFDADALLGFSCVTIGDAVGELWANLLDPELKPFRDVREEKDHAQLVARSVLEWCALQDGRSV